MSRFKAIGHFVYEKGDRIGVTLDEAAIELAQKLNAYQMRVERFKEQDKSQTEAHRINTSMWKDDLDRYKEMCDELDAECARLKAEVDRLAMSDGYHYTAVSISTLKEQLHQKHLDYVEARKANEAKVEMINNLKAEVERLTAFTTRTIIPNQELQAQVERLTKAGDAMADSINGDYNYSLPCIEAWKAAKEGKPKNSKDALEFIHTLDSLAIKKQKEEIERLCAWGRGLESDLSHARVEISFLKAESERLKEDNRQLTNAFEIAEGIIKRMGKAAEAAAKEGKQP